MDKIKQRLKEMAENGKVSCRDALCLARELDCPVDLVGKACDELEIKIIGCQLGCF